jgi:hypothetical protein
VGDSVVHEIVSLAPVPVPLLQRPKTTYIKWLQQMRQVRRHAKSDGIVLFTVLLEFERVVALVTVKYEQLVHANIARLCMLIKVLQPLQAKLYVVQPFSEAAIT